MTNFSTQSLHRIVLVLGVFFAAGCEDPQRKAEQIVPPSLKTEVAEDVAKPDSSESGAETTTSQAKKAPKSDPRKEPEDALLDVRRRGDKIVLTGALKSRIQIARIEDDLKRAFPKLTIENNLELEFHRYPVGWGNRISSSFLVPYFETVNDAHIRYEKGIVLLEGRVKNTRQHREVTELAVYGFSGAYTEDIDNKISVSQ